MTKPITVTTLTNGDGVLDPYKRQTTGKNKGATDCVKITIPKGTKIWGQVTKRTTTKVVSFDKFLGEDYDFLDTPEARAKLIYNPQSPISSTRLNNYLRAELSPSESFAVNVKWASTAKATSRFADLVRQHKTRYKKLKDAADKEAWENCVIDGRKKDCPYE